MLQQDIDPSQGLQNQIVYGKDDIYSQVITRDERRGRTRGLGFGSGSFNSSSSSKSVPSTFIEHLSTI